MSSAGKVLDISVVKYYNKYILPRSSRHTEGLVVVCPFHSDTDPSFHLRTNVNKFKCFGCGVSGGIVRLHALTRSKFDGVRLSDREAEMELAELYGVKVRVEGSDGKIKTVFDKARETLNADGVPENEMSYIKYMDMNGGIIRSSGGIPLKIAQYADLDLSVNVEMVKREL